MEIQSEWKQPVVTRHNGVQYQFKPGEIKDVPDDFDIEKVRYFKVVDAGSMNKQKDKNKGNDQYKKELIDLPKIGIKKAEDIISLYPTRKELVNAVLKGGNLPWDSDIDKILKEHFKGGN